MERCSIQQIITPSTRYQEANYQTHETQFISFHQIKNLRTKKTTYTRIFVSYRPQKEEPYRVQITVVGDKIHYAGDTFTSNSDITTSKYLFNSVISTKFAKFLGLDIKYFYLNTAMDEYEHMWLPQCISPQYFIDEHHI